MANDEINYEEIEKWIDTYNKYRQEKRKKQILTLIVLSCKPLVRNISYGLARRANDPVEDILQVANIGLIKAVKRYKPEYKNLKTFLSYAIVGEIKHYLRDKTSLIKIPREIIELSYRINKLSAEDIELAGESYNEGVLAKSLNTTKEKIRETVERRKIISLDQIQFDDNDKTYEEILSKEEDDDEDDNPEIFESYKKLLENAINILPMKSKQIIKSIYFDKMSQVELAKEWGTSQSNISRMQKRALRLLFDIITTEQQKREY